VRVERAGGERIFSRVAQEYSSGLHVADAVSTGDAGTISCMEAAADACALGAGGCCEAYSAGASRSGWALRDGTLLALRDRLQTTPNLWRMGWPRKVLPTHSIRDGKAKLSRSAIKVWKEDPTAVETRRDQAALLANFSSVTSVTFATVSSCMGPGPRADALA
jgi:hypothetical protein